jgi:hypothetical protein
MKKLMYVCVQISIALLEMTSVGANSLHAAEGETLII